MPPDDDHDNGPDSDFELTLPPWIVIDNSPIEAGSIVQLRSGGPLLTAASDTSSDPIQAYGFDRQGEFLTITVPAACLRKLAIRDNN